MLQSEHHKLRVKRRTIINTYGTAKPYLRTGMAFVAWLRFGGRKPKDAYAVADTFLGQLELDLEEQDGTE